MRGFIGVIAMLQGAVGFIADVFFDNNVGILSHWFDLSPAAHLGVFVLGAGLAVWGDVDKKRRQRRAGAGSAQP
ncbi:hypothetical protein [Streptomyces chattanoogensis]|uniref:Uncharacterized protein n=1 Tax=Streptomyces chattanoogensis TaxID=66876 RepID=A0A0N0GZ19_9ACTN|nr:hypothetical protein [Streptomyces chattanoogensis]KPC62070.1 hypothetical protein ADL29_19920 [Streptomyces chattanoogensis]